MNRTFYSTVHIYRIFILAVLVLTAAAIPSSTRAAKETPSSAQETGRQSDFPADESILKIGLFEGREPTTLRIQAMKGNWKMRLLPRPVASGSEPILSEELVEPIPEAEDITVMLTSKGITVHTSAGKELETGFSRCDLVGGTALLVESVNRQPIILAGPLAITFGEKALSFTHQVPLSSYLTSIVSELVPSSEPEAVKAAVIAARSQLFRAIIDKRHATDSFDLCDTPHCSPFSGDTHTRDLVALATTLTNNEIMVQGGKPISARMQHTCGGKISSMKDVHGIDDPNHQALDDKLDEKASENCFHSPAFNWIREFTLEEIAEFLSSAYSAGSERMFFRWDPSKVDPAGRIVEILLQGKRTKKLRGTAFLSEAQHYFGVNSIRSMRFTAESMRRAIIYRGTGSGDGVGMCLFGADGLARKGLDVYRILQFYYRNFELRKNGVPLNIPISAPSGITKPEP